MTLRWPAATAAFVRSKVVPSGYIDGLILSNDGGTPNTKLDVAAGVCRDDTNPAAIVLNSGVVIDCATNGVNGLDTGALANNTWYHVFAILGGVAPATLASTSASSPTLPAGYTLKRRIGSFRTDGSAHIIAFKQNGDEFIWSTVTLDVNGAATSTTAALNTLTVAPVDGIHANIRVGLVAGGGAA